MKNILVISLLLLGIPLRAQEPPRHRIADKKFWFAVGLAVAATVADVETTAHCVKLHACIEGNPLYDPRPSRAKMYAIGAPVTGVSAFFAYYMKHERFDRTWWIPLAPVTAVHGYATIRNWQFTERLEHHCPIGTTCTFQ